MIRNSRQNLWEVSSASLSTASSRTGGFQAGSYYLSMICDAFALCSPFILTRMQCLPMLGCDSVSLNLPGRAGPTQQN